jgi:ABC-type multidrug transport system fused ATPase/permease subunit
LSLGALRLLPLLQQLYQAWVSLAANRAIVGEVVSLLSLPVSDDRSELSPLPLVRSIRFDGVSFTYPDRQTPALKDVDLVIPSGARVAIAGKTGSGKSTLVDLLMGLLEPSGGSITVDEVPLTCQTRRSWRRSIAHVPQSIFLADTSIANNIAFGISAGSIDLERVAEAARIAQLDEVIAGLPLGFETRVGERGISLSGGQRQRLGLARAIYKDAPVLILDEATNALDRETEEAVLGALDDLQKRGRTIIIVSHRKSAIEGCDMVIRMDQGRIVQ